MELISLSPPSAELDPAYLEANGGFAWWYVDAINSVGDGFVCIWSFGLPFLPGYTSAAREDRAPRARTMPSLNLVCYKNGAPNFYALQTFAENEASIDGSTMSFGNSTFVTQATDSGYRVTGDFEIEIPGSTSPAIGSFKLDGNQRIETDGEIVNPLHDWSPICANADATLSIRHADWRFDFSGSGYHDRNGGKQPFDKMGMKEWRWYRATFDDHTIIFYLVEGDDGDEFIAVKISDDGTTQCASASITAGTTKRAWTGRPYDTVLKVSCDFGEYVVTTESIVDAGPFYLRFFVSMTCGSDATLGTGERCWPERVDLDLHRPFVKMRVLNKDAMSMWAPLFSGPKSGRWNRLLSSWKR